MGWSRNGFHPIFFAAPCRWVLFNNFLLNQHIANSTNYSKFALEYA